jgi:hypothetical protein
MRVELVEEAVSEGLLQVGISFPLPDVRVAVDRCQVYRLIRATMHGLDERSGRLSVRRYAFKAVAGAMTQLLERQGCTE